MKWLVNIFISIFAFAIAYGIAFLTGISTVQYAVLIAFFIHWIAFIPAFPEKDPEIPVPGSLAYVCRVNSAGIPFQSISLFSSGELHHKVVQLRAYHDLQIKSLPLVSPGSFSKNPLSMKWYPGPGWRLVRQAVKSQDD